MQWQLVAPAAIVFAAALLVLLERLFPYRQGQRLLREGFWTDLILYSLVQNWVLALVIGEIIRRLAGARSHACEILINQTIEFAPMILLGAAPEVPLIKGMISGIWGMYIHSNIDVRTGRLQLLINGPEAHRWHHSTDLAPPGMNFATKLAIWDVLFGTFWLPPGEKPKGYGLTYVDFPTGYLRQHLFAFRPWRETARRGEADPAAAFLTRTAAPGAAGSSWTGARPCGSGRRRGWRRRRPGRGPC